MNCAFSKSGASGKELADQRRRHKRRQFEPWVGKIPWRTKWQPTLVFLPVDRGTWGAIVHGSDMTEVLGMHAFKARLLGYLNDISIIVIEK